MNGFNFTIMQYFVCRHIKQFFDQFNNVEIEDSAYKMVRCKHCHLEIHYHCHYNGFSIDHIYIDYNHFDDIKNKTVNIKKLQPLLDTKEWGRILDLKLLIGKKIPTYHLVIMNDNA